MPAILILFLFSLSLFLSFPLYQKRRERGRISIRGIRLVEPAVLNLDGGDSLAPDVSLKILILALPIFYGFSFMFFCVCIVVVVRKLRFPDLQNKY